MRVAVYVVLGTVFLVVAVGWRSGSVPSGVFWGAAGAGGLCLVTALASRQGRATTPLIESIEPDLRMERVEPKTLGRYVQMVERFVAQRDTVETFAGSFWRAFTADETRWPNRYYVPLEAIAFSCEAFEPEPAADMFDVSEDQLRRVCTARLAELREVVLCDRWQSSGGEGMPAPWLETEIQAVEGVNSVGLGRGGSLLLVVSERGRGLFDCRTGERVALDRHRDEDAWLDRSALTVVGIGPLSGERVRIAGVFGGGLPVLTRDGWSVHRAHVFGTHYVWAERDGEDGPGGAGNPFYKLGDQDEPLACGFSESGNTLVVAWSNLIRVWVRPCGSRAASATRPATATRVEQPPARPEVDTRDS